MLTRIFATSKPLNYILVGGYVFVVFVLQLSFDTSTVYDLVLLLKGIVGIGAIFFSVLLFDFIVRKNSLSRPNTFIVLVYGCLLAFLPIEELFFNLIFAQILLLFGIRRSISLRSNKRTVKKIFDAAFWIAVAMLFYFWSSIYLLALYAAILYFSLSNYRYWLLPICGLTAVAILYYTAHLVWFDQAPSWSDLVLAPNFDFSSWLSLKISLIPTIYLGLAFISGLVFYLKIRKTLFKLKRVQLYCILMLILASGAAVLGPSSQPETWIIMSFPLAVVAGNVAQDNTHRLITELLLWILVLSPIMLAVFL